MNHGVKYKSMLMLLPFLAACSGGDGGTNASLPQLDTPVAPQNIAQPATTVTPLSDFDLWTKRMMADAISPVTGSAGDLTQTWTGADGKSANLVVRAPRTAGKPTVPVSPPANGADATPAMQAGFDQLRKAGGGILKIAPGEYHFKTGIQTEQAGLAQFLISKVSDVDIQAAGAHFVFETNCDGVFFQAAQRVRLQGASMEDARELSGYGRMRKVNGVTRLELDKPLPAGVTINWVQPMNEGATRSWPQTQTRTILTPTSEQPTRVDDRTFTAPGFKSLPDGQYVGVKYTWYGKRAIFIRDTNKAVNEDIIIDGVRIGSVGGIAIMLKTRGRGFAIQNSSLSASAGRPFSANYDGIHVISAAGDVLIRGNSFAHTGDDQINLRSIIHKATDIKADSVTLSNDGRMIRAGDEVAFFNSAGEYLGLRVISTAPPLGNSDTITFGLAPGEPINEAAFARVVNITMRRFAVVDNTMTDSAGRGMLIQVPIGLVQGNVVRGVPHTAVRMLTSFDPWMEGAGAINVRITGNTFDSGGAAMGLNYVTGIVTALAELISTKIPTNTYNGPIKIDNNKFTAPRAACIAVYNTKGVIQENNTCGPA